MLMAVPHTDSSAKVLTLHYVDSDTLTHADSNALMLTDVSLYPCVALCSYVYNYAPMLTVVPSY